MKNKSILIPLITAVVTMSSCYGTGYSNTRRTYQPSHSPERRVWRENARVPNYFENRRQTQRQILNETRGADFNNPRDRRDAEIRANQLRERAWRRQTQKWNHELERRGYRRTRR